MGHRIVNRTFRLLNSGIALPGNALTNDDLKEKIERLGLSKGRNILLLAQRMGIESRYLSRDLAQRKETPRLEHSNPKLAAKALQQALLVADLKVSDLDYIIGHTTSPHTLLPPNISWVADELDYHGVYAELRQACTGFANALQLASGMLSNPIQKPIGIVGSETGSVFFDPNSIVEDKQQLINLAQMGDGAAAVIIAPDDQKQGSRITNLFFGSLGVGEKAGLSLSSGGSSAPFISKGEIISFEHDFAHVKEHSLILFEEGLRVVQAAGINLKEIQWIIPHQANGKMGSILAPLLNMPVEKFFTSANQVGNTGSASIWIALHQLRTSNLIKNGDKVLVLGAEATKFLYGGFIYHHYE